MDHPTKQPDPPRSGGLLALLFGKRHWHAGDPDPATESTEQPDTAPSTQPPTITQACIFEYTLNDQFSRLVKMAYPAPNETPAQAAFRQKNYDLSVLCSTYSLSLAPAPAPPDAAITTSGTQLTGLPPTSLNSLIEFIEANGNLAALGSLFLTLWNAESVSRRTPNTTSALQVWQKWIGAAGPSPDIPFVMFFDGVAQVLYLLPSSSLASLASNNAISEAWSAGLPFSDQLASLAEQTYKNPFSPDGLASAAASGDWISFSTALVTTAAEAASINPGSPFTLATANSSIYGSLDLAGGDPTTADPQIVENYNSGSQSNQVVSIPPLTPPSDTPAQFSDGSVGAVA